MSKANQIAAAVAARLENIRVANGYATDAGQKVFRGRAAIAPDSLPNVILFEAEDLVETQRVDYAQETLPIDANVLLPFVIEATGPCDADNPNVAGHALVADIKKAIFAGDLSWGGLATHTRYIGRTLGPREGGTNLVTVTVQIRVGYVENLAAP